MPNDLKSKGGAAKFFAFLTIISALIIVIIMGYSRANIYYDKEKAAEFCGNCHEMQANYYTWQYTAHSQILCTRCHQKVSPTKIALKYLTSSFNTPVKLTKLMDDNNCLQCHKKDRDISPPGDLIVPHQLHMEKGVDCIDCHTNVSHGDVLNASLIKDNIQVASFTKEMAEKQVIINKEVKMDTCMRCHNGSKATDSCNACHKLLRAPKK